MSSTPPSPASLLPNAKDIKIKKLEMKINLTRTRIMSGTETDRKGTLPSNATRKT